MTTAEEVRDALVDYVERLADAFNDPLDQIRAMKGLATYGMSTDPIAAFGRRLALVQIAKAVGLYEFNTVDEADAVLADVMPLFDAEIKRTADVLQIDDLTMLKRLAGAVRDDLEYRSRTLPNLITIERPESISAFELAYQLYQDTTRADELIALNNPVNPMFMPLRLVVRSF